MTFSYHFSDSVLTFSYFPFLTYALTKYSRAYIAAEPRRYIDSLIDMKNAGLIVFF